MSGEHGRNQGCGHNRASEHNQGRARNQERERLFEQVVDEVERLGFPREFGEVIAGELSGEWSLTRMLGYLRGARPESPEQIADEMLAILQMREGFARKHAAERGQAALTQMYNNPAAWGDEETPA